MKAFCSRVIAGLLIFAFLISYSVSAFGAVELAHDKGINSRIRTLYANYGVAVSFSPPDPNWPIQTLRVYGQRYGNQTEKVEFLVDIWGANRTVLFSKLFAYALFKTPLTWVDIEISGVTVSEKFYVVIFTYSNPQRGIGIGCDTSVLNQHSEIAAGKQRFLEDWSEIKFDPPLRKQDANWMIRVVGGGTPSTATSQPLLGFLDMSTLQQIGGVAATGGSVFLGWFLKTRKRRFVSGYLTRIDSTYNEYSVNREECKKRLAKMKSEAVHLLRKGKIDEAQFTIIDNKLAQYLKDLG